MINVKRAETETTKFLSDQFNKIVIETDDENPVTIAVITDDFVDINEGYRVRLTPKYN